MSTTFSGFEAGLGPATERFLGEGLDPADEQRPIACSRDTPNAWYPRDRYELAQAVDAVRRLHRPRRRAARLPRVGEQVGFRQSRDDARKVGAIGHERVDERLERALVGRPREDEVERRRL